ncbi:hypothetical protein ALP71_05800 [Pseudomonas coronafaciens pv. garcae]|nr:hypothetical protein ALP71_05800 [Pseudomonas coronafaciens pv. garcae]
MPCTVIRELARVEQLIDQRIVIAQQAGGMAAQCNHAGAGQGCDIDHRLWLETFGVGQCIAQHQAAFGVGVENFDCLAAHGGDNVARSRGGAAWHVLGAGQNAHQVDRQFQFEYGAQGAEHTGSAAHVELHLVHAGSGFDADTARVEGDAFADQHERLVAFLAALIVHDDQARWLGAALGHCEKRAHAQIGKFLLVVDFHFQIFVRLAQRLGFFAQIDRVADVRRQVAQVAGQRHAGGNRLSMSGRALDISHADLVSQQGDFLERTGFGFLGLETVEDVFAICQCFDQQASLAVGVAVFHGQVIESNRSITAAQAFKARQFFSWRSDRSPSLPVPISSTRSALMLGSPDSNRLWPDLPARSPRFRTAEMAPPLRMSTVFAVPASTRLSLTVTTSVAVFKVSGLTLLTTNSMWGPRVGDENRCMNDVRCTADVFQRRCLR